jgi:signal transduction histidine kinase
MLADGEHSDEREGAGIAMTSQPAGRLIGGDDDPMRAVGDRVSERALLLARAACLAFTVLMVALFVVAVPARYEQIATLTGLPAFIDPVVFRANLERDGLSPEIYALHRVAMEASFALVCIALASLIFWRRSNDRMALYTVLLLVLLGTTFWNTIQPLSVQYPALSPALAFFDALTLVTLIIGLFLLPDGRFVPRWTGWLAAVILAGVVLSGLFPATPLNPDTYPVPLFLLFILGWVLLGVYAQIHRYRRASGPIQRQQAKWVGFGISAALVGFIVLIFVGEVVLSFGEPGTIAEMFAATLMTLIMALIPLSISAAILRHRLFEIDTLINRALVYGALTACVVGIYVLIVGYLGELLRSERSLLVSLVATGVVAAAFAPLRDYFQRSVNRLMFGERDDPYQVLTRLGERLEDAFAPEAVLPTVVETVREALKLPYVAIALDSRAQAVPAAERGTPVPDPLRLPLVYQNEPVGELRLARRYGEDDFSPADRRLLDDLVRQAGVAVYAVRLTADLQRSRQRLVSAREEERRRLRRDLHDGVGPRLAALVMKLETARARLSHVPEADALLDDIAEQARDAVGDIRRAVHALRPPALDELGLVPALRESAARYSSDGLLVTVEVRDELPALPAAVEVAAYLIAQEAMTNVVRHAGARTCTARIGVDDVRRALTLIVDDDGRGLDNTRSAGVGLSSMRDRAEELGGTFALEILPYGGTRVSVTLPYGTPGEVGSEGDGDGAG